jgi:hypothetical protein
MARPKAAAKKSAAKKKTVAKKKKTAAKKGNPLLVDARAMKFLVDLPDGETQGMRREHEGIAEAVAEIVGNQKKWGKAAGISAQEVAVVVDTTAQIAQIRAKRPVAAKLLEMFDETEAMLEDKRDKVMRAIAESVDAKANTVGPELPAAYANTRAYRSATGVKAAKTRKKNAAAKAGNGAQPAKADG